MNPFQLHRYEFALNEAVEALLGEAAGDCERWEMRVDGDRVVIDVVGPAATKPAQNMPENMTASVSATAAPPEAPTAGRSTAPETEERSPPPAETGKASNPEVTERKGGALAKRAAIIGAERGFWTFADTDNAEDAAEWVRQACGVTSRAELDHDEDAGAKFREIEAKYKLWLDGYD